MPARNRANPLALAVLASGTLASTAVWQAFAVLVALVLTWATRVFRKAVS